MILTLCGRFFHVSRSSVENKVSIDRKPILYDCHGLIMVSNYGLKEFVSLKVNLIDLATAALPSQFVKHKKTSAHLLIKIRPTFSS